MKTKHLAFTALALCCFAACTSLPQQPPATVTDPGIIEVYNKALTGDAVALHWIGFFYEQGSRGFPKDYTRAANCYQISANRGCVSGMLGIGKAYEYGKGRKENLKLARKYYEKAAATGDYAARCILESFTRKYGAASSIDSLFVGGTNEGRQLFNEINNFGL